MAQSKGFDISALSYDDFIHYFFTAPDNELWKIDDDGEEFWFPVKANPAVLVRHLTRFCTEFRQIADRVSPQTLDHGIDGMLSAANFQLQTVLWDNKIPIEERIGCIRSMCRVFADFVANRKVETLEGSYFMWWDHLATSFWFEQTYHRKLPSENYELLPEDDRRIVDAMFETLMEILRLDDDRVKSCALHGLGHLHHPQVRSVVQQFIENQSTGLTADAISWLEKCRDGKVM